MAGKGYNLYFIAAENGLLIDKIKHFGGKTEIYYHDRSKKDYRITLPFCADIINTGALKAFDAMKKETGNARN